MMKLVLKYVKTFPLIIAALIINTYLLLNNYSSMNEIQYILMALSSFGFTVLFIYSMYSFIKRNKEEN